MAKVPVGKVLLRNVIRHTDAHNKARHQLLASISLSLSLCFLCIWAQIMLIRAIIDEKVPKKKISTSSSVWESF